jgi:hypothetical protein
MRDQVSHLFKTTGKIIVLYILIFTSLKQNILNCMVASMTMEKLQWMAEAYECAVEEIISPLCYCN